MASVSPWVLVCPLPSPPVTLELSKFETGLSFLVLAGENIQFNDFHPSILPSSSRFSSRLQSLPASGALALSQLFKSPNLFSCGSVTPVSACLHTATSPESDPSQAFSSLCLPILVLTSSVCLFVYLAVLGGLVAVGSLQQRHVA